MSSISNVVMTMYNLIEYSNNYSKTSRSSWKYYRDETALNDADTLANFPANSASFKFKQKITGLTGNDGTKDVKIMVPLKYLSNFWRTLEMLLINYGINLILTLSVNCVISNAAIQATTFAISSSKFYIPVANLSTQDNANVLQQLKSGFKCTITWNKYQSKTATQNAPNQYLDYLIDASFQKVNRLFVLAFNANDNRIGHSRDYLLNAKIEDYNVMIDE